VPGDPPSSSPGKFVKDYSGGMRRQHRRDPAAAVLDEPATGLEPEPQQVWDIVLHRMARNGTRARRHLRHHDERSQNALYQDLLRFVTAKPTAPADDDPPPDDP
jgi:ABC-type transporter Mla maintaining outer membrane lipid asymmetry ATPase subunit MlaF